MSTKTEAAAWISKKAKWTKPADPMDTFVVCVAVGYAGAEIMASGRSGWKREMGTLKSHAALYGMTDAEVSSAIDKAAAHLMGG